MPWCSKPVLDFPVVRSLRITPPMFPRISKSPSKAIHEKRLMKACADHDLSRIQEAFRALDPVGARTAGVLRNALDQIYDGPNTGRYQWDQLFKTEKM